MLNFSLPRLPVKDNPFFGVLFLMTLIIPLAFTIYTRENFETVKFALWLILAGVLLALSVKVSKAKLKGGLSIRAGRAGLDFLYHRKFLWFLWFFLLWSLVAAVFSPDKLNSVLGFYYRFNNSLIFYLVWAVFLLALCAAGRLRNLSVLLKVLVFDALLIALFGIFQAEGFAYYQGVVAPGFLRSPSFLGNPIFSSMFLASILPFVFYFWHKAVKFLAKIYYGLTAFAIVAAIIVLASRGAWLALAASFAALAVLGVLYLKNKKILLAGGGLLAVACLLTFSFLRVYQLQSSRLVFSFAEENITTRLYAWEMARQAIVRHPLTGVGLGNFQYFFEQNRGRFLSSASQIFDDPHNLFLQLAATGGWPLLLGFLGLLGAPLLVGIKVFKTTNNYFALAGVCSVAAFCAAASFTPVAIPCFLLLAVVLVSLLSSNPQIKTFGFARHLRWTLVVLGIFLIYGGVALITAEHLFFSSNSAFLARNYAKTLKLSSWAIRLNPTNQLYYLYEIGSKVLETPGYQNFPRESQALLGLHPVAANSYSMAAYLNFLAFVKIGQGGFLQQALADTRQSILIDPDSAFRYVRLGYFALFAGQPKLAQQATENGLRVDQTFLPGWLQLAKIYQIFGRKKQVMFALEQAYKLNPDDFGLRKLLREARQSLDIKTLPLSLPGSLGSLE